MKRAVCSYVWRCPGKALLLLLLVSLGAGYFSAKLELRSDLSALLPESFPSVKTLERARVEVGGFDTMQVVLEGAEFPAMVKYAERLAPRIEASELVQRIEFRREIEFFEKHALLYSETKELEDLVDNIESKIRQEKLAANPLYVDLDDDDGEDDEANESLDELAKKHQVTDDQRYFTNSERTLLVISVFPNGTNTNISFARRFLRELDSILEETPRDDIAPALQVHVGGSFKNKIDEYEIILSDVSYGALISISLILVLLCLYFRSVAYALILCVSLGCGIAWTFGVTYLVLGELNIITVFLFVVLFGLGIDYGIHLLARYQEERSRESNAKQALARATSRTAAALITSALTTAAAFCCLIFADFKGFSQFGLIASVGVMASLGATLTVLPMLILWADGSGRLGAPRTRDSSWNPPRWAKTIVACGVAVAVVGAWAFPKLQLEYDFGTIRPEIPGSEEVSKKLATVFKESSSPAIVFARNHEELKSIETKILEKQESDSTPTFAEFRSLSSLIPERQDENLKLIAKLRALLEDDALDTLEEKDLEHIERLRTMSAIDSAITVEDLPKSIQQTFATRSADGVFGLIVPSVRLRDGKKAIAFADDVGRIKTPDGKVHTASSASIVFADMLNLITGEGHYVAYAAFLLVALLVLASVRALRGTLLVLLPLASGTLWLALAMYLSSTKFNLFNVVVVPCIFGIGIDSGVHLYHRYVQEGPGSIGRVLRSTGSAVIASSVTTIVGFGGMLFASHPGLRSIGSLAVIGIGLTLLSCFIVLPAAVQCTETKRR